MIYFEYNKIFSQPDELLKSIKYEYRPLTKLTNIPTIKSMLFPVGYNIILYR